MTRGSSGEDRAAEGLAPALRGGGLRLPGLKRWRSRRDLGQVELAKRAGTNQRQISRIERGHRGCNPSTAQKLAEALGVELQDLQTKYEPAGEVGGGAGLREAGTPEDRLPAGPPSLREDTPGQGGGFCLRCDGRAGA